MPLIAAAEWQSNCPLITEVLPIGGQETLGGAMAIRTPDLLNAIEALYQLSYDPKRGSGNPEGSLMEG